LDLAKIIGGLAGIGRCLANIANASFIVPRRTLMKAIAIRLKQDPASGSGHDATASLTAAKFFCL